jgi:hypothetical protein
MESVVFSILLDLQKRMAVIEEKLKLSSEIEEAPAILPFPDQSE